MAKAVQKIKLSPSRDIPFNKLVLAQSNVRRTKVGISIEDLAEDIARRSLLQSLNVRPISDAEGQDTGMFEVPAGGRRYRALELLVKQKRLAKTAPVPCIVSEAGGEISAEEDSLAENVHRVALHPLDQFRAFQTLREQGRSEEDIAAIFFVSANVVKQRLRLAAVSPNLLDVYADDGMSLEQLMAFSVTAEHARQEQVWENVNKSGYDEPYQIRRLLTERAVRASDKRARFVGLPAYEAAGGNVPAALITGIRSDLPGQITAQVLENIFDSPTGRAKLIPQGAKLIGIYDSQVAFGQSRVLLVWTRLIMPNGRSIVLERQQGADAGGYSGLEDEVDNHWAELFKAALLSTILGVGAELGSGADSGSNTDIIQALRLSAANSLNQTGQQVVRRNLNIQPTLTIRPGFPVRVIVNRDLVLEPYKG
jgi:ParB/RepB/Spo0J family partition protein